MNARNHNFTEALSDPFFEIAPPFPRKSQFGPGRHFVSSRSEGETALLNAAIQVEAEAIVDAAQPTVTGYNRKCAVAEAWHIAAPFITARFNRERAS